MLKIFAVFDLKADAWLLPFYHQTTGTGMRYFTDVCEKDPNFSSWPQDFCLYEIGEWDPNRGLCVMYEAKKELGLASQFIRKEGE